MSRTRLSFWTALGEIGGFYDGLSLLVKIFMGPLSSAFFYTEFLGRGRYEERLSKNER